MRVVANSKRHFLTVAILISSILLVGFANVSYYAEHLLPVILSTNDNVVLRIVMSDDSRSSIDQKEPSNNAATVKAIQKQKNDSLLRGTGNTESESMKQVPDTKQQFPANTHHINTTLGQPIRKNTSSNARKEENNTTASKTKNDAPSDKNMTASFEASNKTRDANTATTTATVESPLNDKTIPWPAMSSLSTKQPRSTQILLTNYGWNHPNQTIGLTHARSIRSTQLLQGIIQHPFFNPISWTKVSSQPTNMTTFVFLDVEMCFETNWPHYGGLTGSNVDTVQNRSTELHRWSCCCNVPQEALRQPIFSSPKVILVLLDCSGMGMRYCCLDQRDTSKTSVVSISATTAMQSEYDLGLPPPAMNLLNLTQSEIQDIEMCKEESRPLLYTFAGAFGRGNLRDKLKPLHNGQDVLMVENTRNVKLSYDQFLLKSKFAATPKGDNLFSYRFAEAMSAGAIPVVHADDWALPFSSKLINWTKCAVIIPEAQVNNTISILSNITHKERCEMRKCVWDTYDRFMKTPERTVVGIIQSLELLMNNTRRQRKRKFFWGETQLK
jgi:hypothetical protein